MYRRGTSAAGRHLVVYAFARPGDGPARLGLSVGRRVGGAVQRNRVKRVLREEFARLREDLSPGMDYVVIARPGAAEYIDDQGSAAIGARLGELAGRAAGAASR